MTPNLRLWDWLPSTQSLLRFLLEPLNVIAITIVCVHFFLNVSSYLCLQPRKYNGVVSRIILKLSKLLMVFCSLRSILLIVMWCPDCCPGEGRQNNATHKYIFSLEVVKTLVVSSCVCLWRGMQCCNKKHLVLYLVVLQFGCHYRLLQAMPDCTLVCIWRSCRDFCAKCIIDDNILQLIWI